MVRRALLVEGRRDDDVVKYSGLAFQRPERPALPQVCRNLVQLVPAFQATMGFDYFFEQIIHRFDSYAELDGAAEYANHLIVIRRFAPHAGPG